MKFSQIQVLKDKLPQTAFPTAQKKEAIARAQAIVNAFPDSDVSVWIATWENGRFSGAECIFPVGVDTDFISYCYGE